MATPALSDPQTAAEAKTAFDAALAVPEVPVVQPVVPVVPIAPQTLVVPEGQKIAIQENADGSVHMKLSTGEEFTGTPLEVSRKIAESKVDTTLYAKDLKSKLDARVEAPPATPQIQGESAEVLAGREFLANETAKYLGFADANALKDAVSQMGKVTQVSQGERAAQQFHGQNPDFPATNEASDALLGVIAKANANGANLSAYNPEHLTMAHATCVRLGLYKPLTQQEIAASRGGQQATSIPNPPPMVQSGAPQIAVESDDPYTMPLDKLRKLVTGR